jgi:AraC-like DNA-binding protein
MNPNPEFFNRLELIFSSIGIILGFLFGFFLILKKNKNSKTNLFLATYLLGYSLRIGKSLLHNYYSINTVILTIFLGVMLVIGPSLLFYSKLLYQTNYSIKKSKYYFHYIPFLGVICFSWIIPNNGGFSSKFFYFGLFFHGLVYSFFTLYWLLQYKSLNKEIKIKRWLIALTLVTILMFTNSILIFFSIVPFYPSSAILFSISVLFLSIWALKNPSLFEAENEKYSNSNLSEKDAIKYMEQLNKLMEKDKLFIDPELTLTKLSTVIGISSKQLSQIINQIENINYSQYVSMYRIEEAKRLLRLSEFKHYKISAIAYESGFNSISSFNASFKKLSNITAIEYRNSFLQ